MSDPLSQPRDSSEGKPDQRRSDADKVLAVLDVARAVVFALFRIFGRRRGDPQ